MYLLAEYSRFKDLISNLAVVTTIVQFLSGILVCNQYVASKTTADSSPLPFLFGFVSAGLWLFYGLTKHDDKIVLVNTIGATLMVGYIVVFYIYTFKKATLLKQICACVVTAIIVIVYSQIEKDYETLISVLGLAACSLTLITVGAPLSQLFHVIRLRNSSCLPFPMILMSLIVSTLWMLYGLIIVDYYIIVPNQIGAVLAALQLSLFVLYPSTPPSPSKSQIA